MSLTFGSAVCLDFPFNALNNSKLISLYIQKKKKTTLKLDVNRFVLSCSVCCHKLNRPLKGIPCTTCKSLVHRKCSRLKISEITEVLKTKEKVEKCPFFEFFPTLPPPPPSPPFPPSFVQYFSDQTTKSHR